ncbi:hypothetical protein SADUNF_Sadunf10G0013100 [Salix dunnii]|uniref:Uncharacterized protein n=1 Tax=Salix dunnii TaxID=1413687 RepID=A0A835JN56_9ROSI|nr:hypothetical protein SADUNF_Sadunf10G0013100 [Salix dunnii]
MACRHQTTILSPKERYREGVGLQLTSRNQYCRRFEALSLQLTSRNQARNLMNEIFFLDSAKRKEVIMDFMIICSEHPGISPKFDFQLPLSLDYQGQSYSKL